MLPFSNCSVTLPLTWFKLVYSIVGFGLQASFRERVHVLASCSYNVLDVKITRWHDDFNVFKAAVKDLEELLIKATDHAVESVSCLRDHIMLIESLQV